MFAYVVMRLVERGVLELDRPLHELLPNERMAHDPRYRTITARMVLSHSTGLPNWGGDTLRLAFDPGTGFRYSGEGYVWLQGVVEEVTGVGLDELARREVLDPLGMDRSGYVWLAAFEDDAAAGHDAGGRPGPVRKYDAPNAAYSLLTTAGDYARFVAAVMEGRGLAPETWAEMLEPALTAAKPSVPDSIDRHIAWALGWGVEREAPVAGAAGAALEPGAVRERGAGPGGPGASYWHWGDNGPFKAFVAWYPGDGLGLVWFANSVHGLAIAEDVTEVATGRRHRAQAWAEYDRWDDPVHVAYVHLESGRFEEALAAYRALADEAAAEGDRDAADEHRLQAGWVEVRVRAMRDPVRVPVERLARLAGDYGPRHVVLEDGVLYYQRDGNPRYRLEPLGDDLFQPVGLETFRIRFEGDDEGRPERIVGLYFDGSADETARDPGNAQTLFNAEARIRAQRHLR